MRFTIDYCVFGFENDNLTIQQNTCSDVCKGPGNGMSSAMTDRLWVDNQTLQYQYCDDSNGAFQDNVQSCMGCLEKVPASGILINCTLSLDL